MRRVSAIFILLFVSFGLFGQEGTYTKNALSVDYLIQNPCTGLNDGTITISLASSSTGTANIFILDKNGTVLETTTLTVGDDYVFNATNPGTNSPYNLIAFESTNTINTLTPEFAPFPINNLLAPSINIITETDNSSCEISSIDGEIVVDITDGSSGLSGGNNFTYTITSTSGLPGFPIGPNTFDGTWNLDLASLSGNAALRGGDYTIEVTDNYSTCVVQSKTINIDDPSPEIYDITSDLNPTVCINDPLQITVDGSEDGTQGPVTYTVYENGFATSIQQLGDGSASTTFSIPYSELNDGAEYRIYAENGFCTPVFMNSAVTLNIQDFTISSTVTNNTKCTPPYNGAINVTIGDAVGALTYSWSGPNSFSSTSENITTLEPGDYTLTVTDNTTTCSETFPAITVGNNPPAITINVDGTTDDTSCSVDNGSINISVSGGTGTLSYAWAGPDGFISTSSNISNLEAGTYDLTVTDGGAGGSGCTQMTQVVIKEILPTISITVDGTTDDTSCTTDNGSIDITATGGSGTLTYSWTGPNAFSSTDDDLTDLKAGTYNLTVTDGGSGCTQTAQVIISEDLPTVNIVVDNSIDDTSCTVDNGSINITATGGSGTLSFSWDGPNGFTSTDADLTDLESGTYNLTVTDGGAVGSGCTETTQVIINNNEPTITINLDYSADDTSCTTDNGSISITVSGALGTVSYSWTGPNGFTSADEDITELEAGTYDLIVTDGGAGGSGCTGITQVIIAEDLPTIAIDVDGSSDDTSCSTDNGIINITTSGGSGSYNYIWTGTGGFNSTDEDLTGLAAGTYDVTVTDIPSGCTATEQVIISEDLPTVTIIVDGTSDDTSCIIDNGIVNITATGGSGSYSYSWTGTGGFNSTDEDLTGLAAGTYDVTVTDIPSGCTATEQVIISEDTPTLSIVVDSQVNDTDCAVGNGSISITLNGTTGTVSYSWTSSNGFTSTDENITGLEGGTYTVTATDDGTGCSESETIVINGVSTPTALILSDDADNVICDGETVTFTASPAGEANYEFFVNNASQQSGASQTFTTSLLNDGDKVTVEVQNSDGCSNFSDAVTLSVITISANLTSSDADNTICEEESVTFTATPSGVSNYEFFLNGISSQTGSGETFTIPSLSDGDKVTVEVTGSNGCTDLSDPISTTVLSISAGLNSNDADNTICAGDEVIFTATPAAEANYEFFINNISKQSSSSEIFTISSLDDRDQVTVIVTGNNTCTDKSDSINISVVTVTAGISSSDADNTICQGESVTFTSLPAGASNYNFLINGVSEQNGTSDSFTSSSLNNNDKITVLVTGNNNCVDESGPITVTVNPLPSVSIVSDRTGDALCEGEDIKFTAAPSGGANYEFFVNNISFQNGVNETYTASGLFDGDEVTVSVTDNNTCSAISAPLAVTVNPLPIATLTSSDANNRICTEESVIFTATPTGADNYNFLLNGVSVQSSATETYTSTTLADGDEVAVVVTNASGCSDTSSVITTTVFNITAGLASDVADNTICTGDEITFTASNTEGGAVSNYEFFVNGNSVQSGASNTYISATLADQDEVTVAVTGSANGCTDTSVPITVTVNALPSASISSSDADYIICEGEPVTFTATPSGESNYEFFLNGISVQDGSLETYSNSNLSNGDEVHVVVTSTNGCTDASEEISTTVNAPPVATLSNDDSDDILCEGQSVTFTADPSGAVNYDFIVNGNVLQSGADEKFTTSTLNDADLISVVVTDLNGCTGTSSVTAVTVIDFTASISSDDADNEICEGETVIFTATPAGAENYEFFVNNVSEQSGASEIFSTSGLADTDEVNVIITGSGSCSVASSAITMTVNSNPAATLSSDDSDNTICQGDDVVFTATPAGANNYEFFINNTSVQSNSTEAYTTSSLSNGDEVKVVVTNVNGCASSSSAISITVDTAPDAGDNTTVVACTADADFNLFEALGGNPVAGGSWIDVDGSGATITGDVADFTTSTSDNYRFTYTVTSTGACPDATATVTVNLVNEFNAGTDNTIDVCTSDTNINLFSSILDNPDAGGFWIDNDDIGGLSGNTLDVMSSTASAGSSYSFTYVVGGADCENDSSTITINVIEGPNAGEDNNVVVCTTQTNYNIFLALNGTPDTGGTWIDVDNTGATINNDEIDISSVPEGSYEFQYVVSGGTCSDATASVFMTIESPSDAGTDNSIQICEDANSVDLFASLGGTPDNGGTWSDLDMSGAILSGAMADFTGVATGSYKFQYVTENVSCENDTAIVTVEVLPLPSAGEDNLVTICLDEPSFDLFAALAGTPDAGGNWNEITASGAVISGNSVDFTGVAEGSYVFQYTVTSTNCGSDVAAVQVDIVSSFDAGSGNTITVCTSDAPVNLYTSLGGTPDEGGVWSDDDGIGGLTDNIFDISGSTAQAGNSYTFTYTLSGGNCAPASSVITVEIETGADAGTGTTVSTCKDNTGLNLFASLGGSPDSGGTWSDINGIGGLSGNFLDVETSSAQPGNVYQFEYTVNGSGACGSSSSIVFLNVLQNSDPACGGSSGANCSLFSVNFDNTLPNCGQENGVIKLNNLTYNGTDINDYRLTLYRIVEADTIQDIQVPNPAGDSVKDRRAGRYFYEILDFTTNLTCEGGFELPLETTVIADTVPGTKQNVTCFGASNGAIQVTVSDSETGQYYYSVDGGDNWTLLPGTRLIDGLPAGFTTVLIGETTNDTCPAEVSVNIESVYPELSITRSVESATCDNNDGAITITSVSGGSGNYDYRFQGEFMDELPEENTFNMLDGGSFLFTVIDVDAGCEKDFSITVPFPGLVQFTTNAISPTCANGGANNGSIEIVILQTGVFEVGISEEQNSDPAQFEDIISEGNGNVDYTFDNLDQGSYYITVVSSGAVCPNRRLVTIEEGPQNVDFTLQQICLDNELTLRLSDLKGEKNTPFRAEIYKEGVVNPVLTENFDGIPTGNFVLVEDIQQRLGVGNFEVRIAQEQQACDAGQLVYSDLKQFSVRTALQAQLINATMSLPYPESPTGSITISNINGGYPSYEIAAYMDSAANPLQSYDEGFFEVPLNSNFMYEYTFSNVPAGRYVVEVMDSMGCSVDIVARVGLNTDIFIPNVFTPNGDTKNDVFFIRNLPTTYEVSLVVTNRWGKKVYSSDNYQNDWDGGEESDGIYFYQLDDAGVIYSGWVQIIRGKLE